MRMGFYPRLAVTGMRKNRKIYLPYLLATTGMVMMYYIILRLASDETIAGIHGGRNMQMILSFGHWVIAVFALIFLFYTHSFLMRRRKREFGLYNILGMGKRNIARVIVWETAILYSLSMIAGLLLGMLFFKLAQMLMIRVLDGAIPYGFTVAGKPMVASAVLFAAIFFLIFLNSLRQLHLASPIELMKSESAGEKPPRANWVLAGLGLVLLGVAYYMAITITEPMSAIALFFVAVILVIIATYLLFISGSVAMCRALQKVKNYYYRPNHFVSVAQMAHRMKRNGAGLASICILCTMVLVVISSTMSLFVGREDMVKNQYPRGIALEVFDAAYAENLYAAVEEECAAREIEMENTLSFRSVRMEVLLLDDALLMGTEDAYEDALLSGTMRILTLLPLDDYNRMTGSSETLEPGEILLSGDAADFPFDRITLGSAGVYAIKSRIGDFEAAKDNISSYITVLYLIFPDMAEVDRVAQSFSADSTELFNPHYFLGFDTALDTAGEMELTESVMNRVRAEQAGDRDYPGVLYSVRSANRAEFYAMYGALFFLGGLLGSVFLVAAVLIMYYKQICEGYEDQARYGIMRKVGMTRRDIRRSVNSQMLTVFFAPMAAAVIHLAAAFNIIRRMLLLFGLTDVGLFALVMGGCCLVFGGFYAAVYALTSRAYCSIVNSAENG